MKCLILRYNTYMIFHRYFHCIKNVFSTLRKYVQQHLLCTVHFSSIILIGMFCCTVSARSHSLSDDSTSKAKELRETASVKTSVAAIKMTVQNVDVTRFPEVRLIVDAFSADGVPLDTLTIKDIKVVENGVEKKYFP
jgi:hypothetical protein